MRIGELARRTGTSPELLRAWEQRYGLLFPSRSSGGFRLYSEADERRVRSTLAGIAEGLSTAQAAGRALAEEEEGGSFDVPGSPEVRRLARELALALEAFDAEGAHAAFDRLLAVVSVESLMREVLLPLLRTIGERWQAGEISVGQEHFASNLVRGRLMGLAHGWTDRSGPALVLACPSGEEHDIPLVMCGIAAARRGRRIVFLGGDTPVAEIEEAADAIDPVAVVIAVTRPEPIRAARAGLRRLAARRRLVICGRGALPEDLDSIGAETIEGDPIDVAHAL